jgi:hypothetical protein
MTHENTITESSILFENYLATRDEPPRIADLYSKAIGEGSLGALSAAEIKLIFHLLPENIKGNLGPVLQAKDSEFWARHMEFRRFGYEAVVGRATTFRKDVASFASLKDGDQVIDLGGGLAPMAPYFADTAKYLEYYDVDITPPAKAPATELIGKLVKDGRLAKGAYIEHSMMNGFPSNIPGPEKGRRIAVSIASASYLPADKLQALVKSSFENECVAFNLVALRTDFSGEAVVQEIEARASNLEETPEGREVLTNARAHYNGLKAFAQEIAVGLPVRSPRETAEYLARVGKVVKAVGLGSQTFGILVRPL